MLSKLALAFLMMSLVSCSMRQQDPSISSERVKSMFRLKTARVELLEADVLLGEKPAIVAQWRGTPSRTLWRTYSSLDNPRRILVTTVKGAIKRRTDVELSLDESFEFQNRLSEEATLLSEAAPKVYREDMNNEQKNAFWTRYAVGIWLASLKRQVKVGEALQSAEERRQW